MITGLLIWLGLLLPALNGALLAQSQQEGIRFEALSFDEARDAARQSGKLIFVDAYTTWCGPCKLLKSRTFRDASVGDFFNDAFINLAVDMERGEGPVLGDRYRVRAYPTLLWIDANGRVVNRTVGFVGPETLLKTAKKIQKRR